MLNKNQLLIIKDRIELLKQINKLNYYYLNNFKIKNKEVKEFKQYIINNKKKIIKLNNGSIMITRIIIKNREEIFKRMPLKLKCIRCGGQVIFDVFLLDQCCNKCGKFYDFNDAVDHNFEIVSDQKK